MEDHTTGQVARAAGISEKAVRMYADRGLLPVDRDARNDHRHFTTHAVRTARVIALLRGVDLTLDEVRAVLDAADPVAAFDDIWGGRRTRQRGSAAAGEHARSALAETSRPDVEILVRSLPERLTLDWHGSATLPRLAETIGAATQSLFDVLHHAQVDIVPAGDNREVYLPSWGSGAPGPVMEVAVPVTAP